MSTETGICTDNCLIKVINAKNLYINQLLCLIKIINAKNLAYTSQPTSKFVEKYHNYLFSVWKEGKCRRAAELSLNVS